MTATTRTNECSAAAVTLYLAFELGSTKWTLGFTTAPAQRPRLRAIAAGDLGALERECVAAKRRFGLPLAAPVQSCYEAGRDGFWVHRWLIAQGIANVVVDSSSIEVNRKARHAKTDRLDARKLLHLLMRWAGGERKVWSVVHVPSAAAEDERQLMREIDTVRIDRTRVRNRIQGLLATQGVRLTLDAKFERALDAAQTGDGRPFPPALRERLRHEWEYLARIEARSTELSAARAALLATGQTRVARVARQLMTLRSLAETSSALFSAELFGTRTFANGRQLGALTGLVPVPYRSDQRVQDQGISKTGRAELRRVDPNCVGVGTLATRECVDAVVSPALRRRRQAGASDRDCGARAQIDHRAVALRGPRRGARRCAAETGDDVTRSPRDLSRVHPAGARRSLFLRVPPGTVYTDGAARSQVLRMAAAGV